MLFYDGLPWLALADKDYNRTERWLCAFQTLAIHSNFGFLSISHLFLPLQILNQKIVVGKWTVHSVLLQTVRIDIQI